VSDKPRHFYDRGQGAFWTNCRECPGAAPNGEVTRARYNLWKAGIEVPEGARVRHLDGDKANDDVANLEVWMPRDPTRFYVAGGYAWIYAPECPYANAKGCVRRCRYVLWEAGVVIPKGSHIHHKDENRLNDTRGNLEVLTKAEHHRHHALGHIVTEASRRKISESLRRYYASA
jgi:uncharacterized protein YbdZ (MbtH family)